MTETSWRRVAAPGLPPFPALWFHAGSRSAVVDARHPTWRSVEWARRVTELGVWLAVAAAAVAIWRLTPPIHPVERASLLLFLLAFVGTLLAWLLRTAATGVLARRCFAARTTVWFSEERITIFSRLYPRPVTLWRVWGSRPVQTRFHEQPDRDAAVCLNQIEYGKQHKRATDHLREARLLAVVLTTVDRRRGAGVEGHDAVLRSIPVTEVDGLLSARFAMVLTAAAAMTAPGQHPSNAPVTPGRDIEA